MRLNPNSSRFLETDNTEIEWWKPAVNVATDSTREADSTREDMLVSAK